MASVNVKKVFKKYGDVQVVHGIDLGIEDGSFVVLLGPSGCGKSTLLRMIAGLESISAGDIEIGGRRVNDVHPKDRNIAMVFQNYALYAHMKVRDNMSFSLQLAKRPQSEIDEKVAWAAKILNLEPYLDRYPRELSGGQSSAWPWAAPSCAIPQSSSSTSLCRTSMPSCASRCAPRSRSYTSGSRQRRSM